MDYASKLLKAIYDIVELMKVIKKQNDTIIHRLESIDESKGDKYDRTYGEN